METTVVMYPLRAKWVVNIIYSDGGGSPVYLYITLPTLRVLRLPREVKYIYQTLDYSQRNLFTYKVVSLQTSLLFIYFLLYTHVIYSWSVSLRLLNIVNICQ